MHTPLYSSSLLVSGEGEENQTFTKHKHLLVFIDLHFQFFSKILMFSVDLLFMFLGYNLENEEIL